MPEEAGSHHKLIRDHFDRLAAERDKWIENNAYYYENDRDYLRFLTTEGQRVLDLGCGTGELLSKLKPGRGVGVDISGKMIDIARDKYPHLEFHQGNIEDPETLASLEGPFDAIILSDTIGDLDDCQRTLAGIQKLCSRETRLIIAYYSHLWEPVLELAARLKLRMPQPETNWLSTQNIISLMQLTDFEVIRTEWRQLLPLRLFGLGPLVNRLLSHFPFINKLCLRSYIVARSLRDVELDNPSTTVLIPCRNEKGNIAPAMERLPLFCDDMEIIFVEGHSRDDTYEECLRVKDAHPDKDIKVLRQDGIGKGDAVRKGFGAARGDILMILDSDLTIPPEELPKFYDAIASGKGEFINGTRFVYPMENEAMRFLNYWANRTFSLIFSYLLNQRFTDTLCGTKVLTKKSYQRIENDHAYFGDFDPFGDFELIFGVSKQNLKVIEIPVRYGARTYGTTQISRFSHGWLLLRMVLIAIRKMKVM